MEEEEEEGEFNIIIIVPSVTARGAENKAGQARMDHSRATSAAAAGQNDVFVDLTDPGIVSPIYDFSQDSGSGGGGGVGSIAPAAAKTQSAVQQGEERGIVSPLYDFSAEKSSDKGESDSVPATAAVLSPPSSNGGGGGKAPPSHHEIVSPIFDFSASGKKQNGTTAAGKNVVDGVDPNHVEVSLEDDAASPTEDILGRAAGFFVENNDNYRVSWEDASHMISDAEADPSRPPVPGLNRDYVTWRLRRIIESIWFRVFTILLIFIDLVIVIVDLSIAGSQPSLQIADLVISIYFVLEVALRMFVLTPRIFFSHFYNVIDFVVILSTFIMSVVAFNGSDWAEGLALFTAIRFLRIFRIVRIYTEKHNLEAAARQLISQNKRRYQQDGFDLDLTYVTNRVIATSFPSTGWWAIYRNPIEKVALFLDTKHPQRYKLFNLCSEKTYDTSFFHDMVERVMIDDHNVPSVEQMLEFTERVRGWLGEHPDNVIVVHCKGGKGRTGTMICIWLIESGVFSSATNSLDYFGNRRTDTNVSKKFQGVETPSQSRYVGYYETVKNRGRILPDKIPLKLTEITITGMMFVGKGDGSDFWVEVDEGRGNTVFSAVFGTEKNCSVAYSAAEDTLVVKILNSPVVRGDVRVLFQSSSPTVPKHYEKCPFYFWFHTGFIEDGELVLRREELDNPHKAKTWHCFRESFSVRLKFEQQ